MKTAFSKTLSLNLAVILLIGTDMYILFIMLKHTIGICLYLDPFYELYIIIQVVCH